MFKGLNFYGFLRLFKLKRRKLDVMIVMIKTPFYFLRRQNVRVKPGEKLGARLGKNLGKKRGKNRGKERGNK